MARERKRYATMAGCTIHTVIRCLIAGAPGHLVPRYPCPIHRPDKRNNRLHQSIRDRDVHRCVICGRPCPHPQHHHVDHIIPKAHGGPDTPSNLRTVCRSMNLRGRCQ